MKAMTWMTLSQNLGTFSSNSIYRLISPNIYWADSQKLMKFGKAFYVNESRSMNNKLAAQKPFLNLWIRTFILSCRTSLCIKLESV